MAIGNRLLLLVVVGCLVGHLNAQVPWSLRVVDLLTGAGIQGVKVSARTSKIDAATDANGLVEIMVNGDREDTLIHGHPGYGYQTGHYDTHEFRVIYLPPLSAYHKTPLISPATGTVTPATFQGVTGGIWGSLPYTIEVEIPPNVLPCPASFWILPVPAYASPLPKDSDRYVASAIAQFVVELKDAQGNDISTVLPAPGITVRATPSWYPIAQLPSAPGLLHGGQARLTKISGDWNQQPEETTWDPTMGKITTHVRACSWILVLMAVLVTIPGDTPLPPSNPAPEPQLEIIKADCLNTSAPNGTFVHCGNIAGATISSTLGTNGTVHFDATFMASLTASLGIGPQSVGPLLSRISAMLSATVSGSASAGVSVTSHSTNSVTLTPGTAIGYPCYTGDVTLAAANRLITIKYGSNEANWWIPEAVVQVYCLNLDPACGAQCEGLTGSLQLLKPRNIRICPGDSILCN